MRERMVFAATTAIVTICLTVIALRGVQAVQIILVWW